MDGKPLSGPGRLTLAMVDSFQVWYGQALRKNKGDTNRMSTETKAILHHYSEDADHTYCPNGINSWCKWKTDQETGDNTYTPVSNPLPAAVVQILKPVFDSLSDPNLLQGCKNCLTQNQNESLHHVVWGYAPKDQYHSAHEVDLAISLGVLTFNTGISKCMNIILPSSGLRFTEKMQHVFGKIDCVRIYEANRSVTIEQKEKRKINRYKKRRKLDAFRHSEGTLYKSGKFHSGAKSSSSGRKCTKCGKPRKGHKRGKCS